MGLGKHAKGYVVCDLCVCLQVRKLDWCVWMCSFLSTMFLGVEIGLAISIGLALMIVIYESAFPHTALLGRVGRTTIYRNVKQFPDSQVGSNTMLERTVTRVVVPVVITSADWGQFALTQIVAHRLGRGWIGCEGKAAATSDMSMSEGAEAGFAGCRRSARSATFQVTCAAGCASLSCRDTQSSCICALLPCR